MGIAVKVEVKTSKMRVGPDSRPRAMARVHVEFLQPFIRDDEAAYRDGVLQYGWFFPLHGRSFIDRYPAR